MLCKIYFPNSKLRLAYNILIVCYKSKDFSGTLAPFFCQLEKVRGTLAAFLRSERVKHTLFVEDDVCIFVFFSLRYFILSIY